MIVARNLKPDPKMMADALDRARSMVVGFGDVEVETFVVAQAPHLGEATLITVNGMVRPHDDRHIPPRFFITLSLASGWDLGEVRAIADVGAFAAKFHFGAVAIIDTFRVHWLTPSTAAQAKERWHGLQWSCQTVAKARKLVRALVDLWGGTFVEDDRWGCVA